MIEYKGFEIFSDPAMFDLTAIRPIGEKEFKYSLHTDNIEHAKETIDEIHKEMQKMWRGRLDVSRKVS